MDMRKIGVLGSFAAGTALALAPLAAADDSTGFDFSSVLASEIQSMNFLFESQATLAGVGDKVIDASEANPFLTINQDDVNAAFGMMLYGVNWEDEISSDPGSYSLLNGALTQFIDGNNVLLFAILNGGDQIEFENAADYLFGSDAAIAASLAGDSAWEDAANFFQAGIADLGGYFAIDL
ncbi:hypothetical protein ABW16_14965 [Mycolicibacter heraklionensis]|uniref:Porin n=2 Tax=Mycolicibacter heraklionensis TaxID=512402 RepID=A0A9X7WKK0_9MYCO|nr:hypothetical protein [Mycolicibacter heraklionensis]KLO27871.1 hypothetical protein ABW16_14965 [Mycolicibacter heraklionensis]QZA09219.1 hypothetical protein K3U94_08245 [Mycolicibacter heraklionensis]